jgi:hypothetical protein
MAGGRRCTVCDHPRLREITSELMARRSYRQIQSKFKISKSALDRHVARHVPQALRKLTAELVTAAEVGESVLTQMGKLNARALPILEQAEAAEDRGIALQAIRECRRNLELIARLTGELAPGAVTGAAAGPLQVTVQYVERQALAWWLLRLYPCRTASKPMAVLQTPAMDIPQRVPKMFWSLRRQHANTDATQAARGTTARDRRVAPLQRAMLRPALGKV